MRLRKYLKNNPGALARSPSQGSGTGPGIEAEESAAAEAAAAAKTAAEAKAETNTKARAAAKAAEEAKAVGGQKDGDHSEASDLKTTQVKNGDAQAPKDKMEDRNHGHSNDSGSSKRMLHRNSRYDYYLCFDVEATCETGFSFEFPNEVIEFPVVLLDGSTFEIVDEFHSYVKPTHRPTLSEFCVGLTGISQETIDDAPTFTEVLSLFEDWLTLHGIILEGGSTTTNNSKNNSNKKNNNFIKKPKSSKYSSSSPTNNGHNPNFMTVSNATNDFSYGATFCFVTDGPFDIRDFISKQCVHSNIPRPSYFAKSYIDVRTMFRDYFDLTHWLNLEGMLTFLGETFLGRQHSGICDSRMVALIAKQLAIGFAGDGSEERSHPVFNERNQSLLALKWSNDMIEKLKRGCVLKANRSTNHTFVKMITFKQLEKLEALGAAASGPPPTPPPAQELPVGTKEKRQSRSTRQPKVDTAAAASLSSPPPTSSASPSSPTASFAIDSKFSALMTEALE
ncbi:hypothetical protein BGZ54_004254 [Gamsiella multidivaricata]|nr:hypothetical protein BGZ54_004254 [Gamsiella multidivaricata]